MEAACGVLVADDWSNASCDEACATAADAYLVAADTLVTQIMSIADCDATGNQGSARDMVAGNGITSDTAIRAAYEAACISNTADGDNDEVEKTLDGGGQGEEHGGGGGDRAFAHGGGDSLRGLFEDGGDWRSEEGVWAGMCAFETGGDKVAI